MNTRFKILLTILLSVLFASTAKAVPVLQIGLGGTGTSTLPLYGQMMIGDNNGRWNYVATSSLGLLSVESDPIFVASPAYGIASGDITNWNTAYSWGNWNVANKGFFFSTSSADYWDTTKNRWTSANATTSFNTLITPYSTQTYNSSTFLSLLNWYSTSTRFLTTTTASLTYQPIGSYLTTTTGNWAGTWQTFSPSHFLTSETDPLWTATSSNYLTVANAISTYQPIGSYVTGTPWTSYGYVTGSPWTLMGYLTTSTNLTVSNFASPNISQWTNDIGYITSSQSSISTSSVLNLFSAVSPIVYTTDSNSGSFRLTTSTSNYFLNGSGNWAIPAGGSSTPPAGNNTDIQFNNNGIFGGSDNLTYNGNDILRLKGGIFTGETDVVSIYNDFNSSPYISLDGYNNNITLGFDGYNSTSTINLNGNIGTDIVLDNSSLGITLGGIRRTSWPTGGNPFNQWLDTTNTPTFAGLNMTGSITLGGVTRNSWPTASSTAAWGVEGSVQFNNGGDASGTPQFVWDSTHNRLGIGTSTPKYALSLVNGSALFGDNIATLYTQEIPRVTSVIASYNGGPWGYGPDNETREYKVYSYRTVNGVRIYSPYNSSYYQYGSETSVSGSGTYRVSLRLSCYDSIYPGQATEGWRILQKNSIWNYDYYVDVPLTICSYTSPQQYWDNNDSWVSGSTVTPTSYSWSDGTTGLYYDYTTKYVGINTIFPDARLTVNNGTVSDSGFSFKNWFKSGVKYSASLGDFYSSGIGYASTTDSSVDIAQSTGLLGIGDSLGSIGIGGIGNNGGYGGSFVATDVNGIGLTSANTQYGGYSFVSQSGLNIFGGDTTFSSKVYISSGATHAGHGLCYLTGGDHTEIGHCTTGLDSSGYCTCISND